MIIRDLRSSGPASATLQTPWVMIGDASFWDDRPVPLAKVLRWIREETDDCAMIDVARFEALADE